MTTVPFFSKTSAVAVVRRLGRDPRAPLSAMIEIADRCNHVCVHCYQVQGQKGEMTTDELRRVIDELADMGVLFLTISGGEATLREDFLAIVAHARKRRFAVKVYTNGYTMTPELARELRRLAVQEVQISLYSHRAEVHDWVTRVPGSWARTVDGARALIAEGVHVVLKTPFMSVNVDDRQAYVAFVTALGADYAFDPGGLNPREDGDRTPETLDPPPHVIARVMEDPTLVPTDEPAKQGGRPRAASLDESPCTACSGNLHVEANGEVRPCTQLAVSCGDARSEGVRAAWTSDTAESIRRLTWRDHHGCRDCDLLAHCARCFADAAVIGGDALGPYAHACAGARRRYESVSRRPFVVEDRHGVGRDPALGPYREGERGRFELVPHVIEPHDDELAARLGWSRRERSAGPGFRASPGTLVQIRRPGARRAEVERIPAPPRPADREDRRAEPRVCSMRPRPTE